MGLLYFEICPICGKSFLADRIQDHISQCIIATFDGIPQPTFEKTTKITLEEAVRGWMQARENGDNQDDYYYALFMSILGPDTE